MELWIIIATAVIGLIAVAVISILVSGRSSKTKNIAFVGVTGSGKTKLVYHLVTGQSVSTVTSQVRNEFLYKIGERIANVIDMPGHPRVRTEVMNVVKTCDAVMFVVDSYTVFTGSMMKNIASMLYDLLSIEEIIKNRTKFCVVCAKSDIPGARDKDLIKREIEAEFNTIRSNRLQANYVENGEEQQLFLGDEGSDFEFSQISNPLEFVSCSVNANNVNEVNDYLAMVVKH